MPPIVEYRPDPVRPKMLWEGEEEVFDGALHPECPELRNGEVALHASRDGAPSPISSAYMTPAQAYVLAERLCTAAWLAEQASVPEES